jgi:two-component system, NtrC family, sensor histidine kinase GlrK
VQDTRQRLIVLALALIPLTLLLATVFSWLINRPIKQLKASIQQLGQADLRPLPAISGPQDIVELGREIDWLRQRLQALEDQKLRFLRHVSHELKTPLASLREGVALLNDELAGSLNARQHSIVAIMDSSSRDLQKRIEDLIRYGGMMRDATLPPAYPQALAEVLDTVLARHRLTLDAHGIEVETQLDAAKKLLADRGQLETVLDNLLSNAVKFSSEGGRILVKSEPVDGAVALWVCDQGAGIPEDERSRVFEPFFQGARQPASAVRGSGLGCRSCANRCSPPAAAWKWSIARRGRPVSNYPGPCRNDVLKTFYRCRTAALAGRLRAPARVPGVRTQLERAEGGRADERTVPRGHAVCRTAPP